MNKEHIRIKLALLCWLFLAGIANSQVDFYGLEEIYCGR